MATTCQRHRTMSSGVSYYGVLRVFAVPPSPYQVFSHSPILRGFGSCHGRARGWGGHVRCVQYPNIRLGPVESAILETIDAAGSGNYARVSRAPGS